MAKKNNKNRQYTAKPSIIDDAVVESIQENTSVETVKEPTPKVEEVVEETVEISEAPKVVEELPKFAVKEVIPEKVEKPIVEKKPTVTKPVPMKKEEVKKPATKSNLYQLVFIANATPLQVNKTVKRLKELNVLYDYNGTDILGATFASETEAIEQKKYYAGKGLKPTIRRL